MPDRPPSRAQAPAGTEPPTPRAASWPLTAGSLLLLALLWGALALLALDERARILAQATGTLEAHAGELAARTLAALQPADRLLRELAASARNDPLDPPDPRTARAQTHAAPDRVFALADSNGRIVFASHPDSLPASIRDTAWFERLAAAPSPTALLARGTPRLAPHAPRAILARRIDGPGGAFLGVALSGIDLAFFARDYRESTLGAEGLSALFDDAGEVHAYATGRQARYGALLLRPATLLRALAGTDRGHFAERDDTEATRRHYAYHRIEGFDLVAVAALSESELLAPHRHRLLLTGGLGLLLTVVLALGARALRRAGRHAPGATQGTPAPESARADDDSAAGPPQPRAAEEPAWRDQALEQTASAVLVTDAQGCIVFANPAFATLSGYPVEELVGRNQRLLKSGLTPPERVTQLWATLARGERWQGELCNRRKDGTTVWVNARIDGLRNAHGTITLVVSTQEDIHAQREAAERARLHAQVFAQTAEAVLATDLQNRVVAVNPAFTALTGYRPEEVLGRSPRMLASGLQGASFYRGMWRALLDTGHWTGEIWNRRKNGEFYAELLTIGAVRDAHGRPTHYLATFSDLTTRRRDSERLDYLADNDSLTALPSRRVFLDRLRHALVRAERERRRLCLLLVDLDDFAEINIRLGHDRGDLLLIETAQRIQRALRRADTISRLEGDRFAVLVEDVHDAEELPAGIDRLLAAIGRPHPVDGGELTLTASIGLALYPDDGSSPQQLLDRAARAAREARTARRPGCSTYRYSTPEINRLAEQRQQLERHLRHAIERGELSIVWQVQRDLASGRPSGVEALLRSHCAGLGEVAPARLVPVAEQAGLMIPIGYWMLQEIATQLAGWRSEGIPVPRVGINLSAQQLRDANLGEALDATLAALPAEAGTRCCVEIAESALASLPCADGAAFEAFFEGLRTRGIGLIVDDFGSSSSPLGRLGRLPLAALKIDGNIVRALPEDAQAGRVARAVIALGQAHGVAVIAENVETPAQADWLRAAGCPEAQGRLFDAELPAAAAGERLRA